jgi:CHASE3 domain sensor protein
MLLKQANRIVMTVVTACTLLTVVGLLSSYYLKLEYEDSLMRQNMAESQTTRLGAGVQLLNSNARAYIATGEPSYKRAYADELDMVQSHISAQIALRNLNLEAQELALLQDVDENIHELTRIELQAFEVAASASPHAANGLVHGLEYRLKQEALYTALERFKAILSERMAQERIQAKNWEEWLLIGTCAVAMGNAILIMAMLGLFYRKRVIMPLVKMNMQVQNLLAGRPVAHLEFANDASELGELARSFDGYTQMANKVKLQAQHLNAQQASINAMLDEQNAVFESMTIGIAVVQAQVVIKHNRA